MRNYASDRNEGTSSSPRQNGRADPPPPYATKASSSSAPTERGTPTDLHLRHRNHPPQPPTGQSVLKVAMLRSSGEEFVFMDRGYHSDLKVCVSKTNRRARSHFISRIFKSVEHTSFARKKPIGTDETGKATATPPDRIGPGEFERSISIGYDWTRDWDLVLSVNNESKDFRDKSYIGEQWRTYAHLFFNDLSGLGCEAVPWNDAARTQRLAADVLPRGDFEKGWIKFTWKFCERSKQPRWGGRFIIYYKGCGTLAGVGDSGPMAGIERPWRFFNTKDCIRAEVDCRTGDGLYKKVMWYNYQHGYGNDVLNEPVETRKSSHDARFAEFVKGLLPRMP